MSRTSVWNSIFSVAIFLSFVIPAKAGISLMFNFRAVQTVKMFQNETIWRFRLVFAIEDARTVPMVRHKVTEPVR
jgi:hypothetical protein